MLQNITAIFNAFEKQVQRSNGAPSEKRRKMEAEQAVPALNSDEEEKVGGGIIPLQAIILHDDE